MGFIGCCCCHLALVAFRKMYGAVLIIGIVRLEVAELMYMMYCSSADEEMFN